MRAAVRSCAFRWDRRPMAELQTRGRRSHGKLPGAAIRSFSLLRFSFNSSTLECSGNSSTASLQSARQVAPSEVRLLKLSGWIWHFLSVALSWSLYRFRGLPTCRVPCRAFSLAAGQPAQSVVGRACAALFPLPLSCPLRQPGHARSTWLPRTRVQSAGLKTPLWRVQTWRINQLPAVTGAVCE